MEKEVTDLKGSMLKVLGLVAAIVGAGAGVLGTIVSNKQMDAKIEETVQKALSKNQ